MEKIMPIYLNTWNYLFRRWLSQDQSVSNLTAIGKQPDRMGDRADRRPRRGQAPPQSTVHLSAHLRRDIGLDPH